MLETDETIIVQLIKEYVELLPKQIDQDQGSAACADLVERRRKIGLLLKNAYGISLKPLTVARVTRTDPHKPRRSSSHVKRTRAAETDTEDAPKDRSHTLPSQIDRESEERKRNRQDIAQNIAALRAEYNVEIPRRLKLHISEAERRALTARRAKIPSQCVRGFGSTRESLPLLWQVTLVI